MRELGLETETIEDDDELWMAQRVRQRGDCVLKVSGRPTDLAAACKSAGSVVGRPALGLFWLSLPAEAEAVATRARPALPAPVHAARRPARAPCRRLGGAGPGRARGHGAGEAALRPRPDLPARQLRGRHLMTTAWDERRPPDPDLIADCVHCGFCLPTCPSYTIFEEEMDSPRGRIVLMRIGNEPGSAASEEMRVHLDRCLGCMACVTACPSGVQYDKLIEQARPQIERNAPRPRRERLYRRAIFALFTHPGRLRALAPLLWVQQRLGVNDALAQRLDRVPELQAMLKLAPPVTRRAAITRLPEVTPARGAARGRVALMQGCVQRVFFGDVNAATVRVLSAEGWEVHAPRQPRCCGALQLHAGVEEEALGLAGETIAAYEDFDAVAVNVAGCGSAMKDYAHLLSDDPEWAERAAAFSAKVRDVTELLAEHEPVAPRHPLPLRVAYHDACHLAHAQAVRAQPRALLRGDPGARAARARRLGDLLRLGRDLQPRAAGGRGRARRPQGGQPPRHRRRRRRGRQPGLRAADQRAPRRARAADLPPDDPAGPLDQRNPPMRLDVAPTREEQLQEVLSAEALDFVGRAARALRAAAARAAGRRGASGRRSWRAAARSTSCPRRARSARATGRSPRRRPTTATGAWRSQARPTASW